jgi:hypothetical protein
MSFESAREERVELRKRRELAERAHDFKAETSTKSRREYNK